MKTRPSQDAHFLSFLRGLRGLGERQLGRWNRAEIWKTHSFVWGQHLCIPTADRLLYAWLHRLGLMGAAERRFFEEQIRPGMAVLDIGANIGLYALLFARLAGPEGRVCGFEPDPVLFQAAADAARLNGCAQLELFPVGLGVKAETRRLRRSFFNSGDNRVLPGAGDDPQAAEIALARGDDLLAGAGPIDFIKIDVQGWELQALQGLRATIERSARLQIYLEFWPQGLRDAGSSPEALLDFLHAHGFTLFRRHAGRWTTVTSLAEISAPDRGQGFLNLWARKTAS